MFYKGYIETKDKKSIEKIKGRDDFKTFKQVQSLPDYAGILANDTILIDIDDYDQSEILMDIVEDKQLACRVYETTRGKHFLFKNKEQETNRTGAKLSIGIKADIKLGSKNSYEVLKHNGIEREIIYDLFDDEEPETVPKWLFPIKSNAEFLDMDSGEGRNQALFNYILTLQSNDFSKEESKETIEIINGYILKEPLEESELEIVLRDDAFSKPVFFKKNAFLFDKFAVFLKNNHHIKRINGQLHIYKDGIYTSGYDKIESAMIKHIPSLNRAKRSEVLAYLEILITENEKSEDAAWIAFRNGLLNIFTDEFIDFTSNHIITNKIDWGYNPHAHSDLTDNTLNKMACNDKSIRYLMEEMVGYTLYRRNELGKAFILTGEKSNGKSTFLDMVKTMLGEDNISALDLAELGDRFKTAELFGKMANIGDDINNEYIQNTAVFKKLVTGDRMSVERKGLDPFDFNNYSKLLFSANSIPRLGKGKDSAAVTRRLVIIPFNARFSSDDPGFKPHIKYDLRKQESIEYLIKIAIQGLKRVLDNNKFTISKAVEKEIEEYEEENNPILGFLKSVDRSGLEDQPTKDTFLKYSEYCINNGLTAMSNIQFSKEIKKFYGFDIVDKKIDGRKYRVFVSK
ncbi:phage/plasmid primase, P4 family [Mycobacteroides abscessus]|uniref:DNA primase family protein n=1 Tax=unclassified Desemzia TaxID=2685243 RepID=UPI0009A7FAC0|nr:phage/plasmid primase, P4 family, C-terminal domain [Mycobacteroides abscessus subsp. abscessus]